MPAHIFDEDEADLATTLEFNLRQEGFHPRLQEPVRRVCALRK